MNPAIRYAVCELSLQRYIDPMTATGRRILQRRTAADSAANPCRIAIGFLMLMLAVLTDCAFARGDEITDKAVDHGIIFETNPPYLRYCGTPAEKTAIRINWDVSALGVDHISIRLDDREGRVVARGAPREKPKPVSGCETAADSCWSMHETMNCWPKRSSAFCPATPRSIRTPDNRGRLNRREADRRYAPPGACPAPHPTGQRR